MGLRQYQQTGIQYQYSGQYNVPGGQAAGDDDNDFYDDDDVDDDHQYDDHQKDYG